jgi:hypothetical protein
VALQRHGGGESQSREITLTKLDGGESPHSRRGEREARVTRPVAEITMR